MADLAADPAAHSAAHNPIKTVGIVGGGQLARMMAEAAPALGLTIDVLDPEPQCPAAEFARRVVVGAFDDAAALFELAKEVGAEGAVKSTVVAFAVLLFPEIFPAASFA